jgi:SAM-dependent methyltransferase
MTVPSNWYENFFHGVPLELWRKVVSTQQTNAEADFLFKALQCVPGAHVLDMPCGNGRLSLALAQRGCRVTGVDLSEEFIQEARATTLALSMDDTQPPATDLLQQIEFGRGDMRHLEGEDIYDGAFCLGNSFGYLEHADTQKFIGGVYRALKTGARFVLETGMAAESILPKLEGRTWYQVEDILMTIEHRYVAADSCVDATYTFIRDGKSETRDAKYRVYTVAEIRRMLERAGFALVDLYESTDQQPYELGSGDLFMIAEKA